VSLTKAGGVNDRTIWICKPSDSSRGRGVFLIRDLNELAYDQQYIAQRYIDRPLTIGGYKFDLRLYVLVTSFHPMRAYLYKDGLVRFGTEKYDASNSSDLSNLFSHLTNSSINKYSPSLSSEKEVIGAGCKWDFHQLRAWFRAGGDAAVGGGRETDAGVDGAVGDALFEALWSRIRNVINLTLLVLTPIVPATDDVACFELFGFDILVDDAMNPILLEVNCSPALGADCPADLRVKIPLLSDLTDLLDIEDAVRRQMEAGGGKVSGFQDSDAQSAGGGSSSPTKPKGAPGSATGSRPSRRPLYQRMASNRARAADDAAGTGSRDPAADGQGERRGSHGSAGKGGSRRNDGKKGANASSSSGGGGVHRREVAAKARGGLDPAASSSSSPPSSVASPPELSGKAEKRGQFELIFPFSEDSKEAADVISIQAQMGDKQEPNKIQECFRTIVSQIRAGERVLRKGPAGTKTAGGGLEGAAVAPGPAASEDPASEVTASVAGTGTRAARALLHR